MLKYANFNYAASKVVKELKFQNQNFEEVGDTIYFL